MSIIEKIDTLSKTNPERIQLTDDELKDIFGDDVLEQLIKLNDFNEYLHFIREEENKVYYTKFQSKDFNHFHFRDKDGVFYYPVDEVFLNQIKEMYDERVNKSAVIEKVLEHPKNRLKTLYM